MISLKYKGVLHDALISLFTQTSERMYQSSLHAVYVLLKVYFLVAINKTTMSIGHASVLYLPLNFY